MAIKRSVQLFGDDGPNGPRVSVREVAAPGLGVNNRALKYGEELKSASVNGIAYALAINDDDLDTRLNTFETGGLDAVYRLGSGAAGGGRIVNIDGGAVEARSARAASYADDQANACFRAALTTDTAAGGVGFDAVLRAGAEADAIEAAGTFGFLDRRLMAFDSDLTKVPEVANGLLNGGGVYGDGITILDDGYFAFSDMGSTTTDLLIGHDLIELLDSPYKGLYRITGNAAFDHGTVTLERLDGGTPEFPPDTSASFSVFRPVIASGTMHGRGGVAIAALPKADHSSVALRLEQPDGSAKLLLGRGPDGEEVVSISGAGLLIAESVESPTARLGQLGASADAPTNLDVWNTPTFRRTATFKQDTSFEAKVTATAFEYADWVVVEDHLIPPQLYRSPTVYRFVDGSPGFVEQLGWQKPMTGMWMLGGETPYALSELMIPLTGFIPYGAEITGLKFRHDSTEGYVANSMGLVFCRVSTPLTSAITVDDNHATMRTETLQEKQVAASLAGTFTLESLAVSAGHSTSRKGASYFAAVKRLLSSPSTFSYYFRVSHVYVSYRYREVDSQP